MALLSENPPERILLRRLREDQWNPATGAPKRNGFRRRKTENSLSVFDASLCSPRFVLQLAINDALQKCQSAEETLREKGEQFLSKYGDTPERLMENGWRVAQIPEAAFTLRGFEVSAADETGHCDVTGEEERFEIKAVELAQEASLAPDSEYNDTE